MKRMILCLCIAPLMLTLAACSPAAEPEAEAPAPTPVAAEPEGPTRSIVNITGDLYRAQNNNHHTVFLVTDEGIIMSDPINRDGTHLSESAWCGGRGSSLLAAQDVSPTGLGSRCSRWR